MAKTRTIILYGNSLILSGIAAGLKSEPRLALHQLPAEAREIEAHVTRLAPDVILFDLAVSQPDWTIILAHQDPAPVLIGVMPDSGDMLQITGQRRRAVTRKDLIHVLNVAAPLRRFQVVTRSAMEAIAPTSWHRRTFALFIIGACAAAASVALSLNHTLSLSGVATGAGAPAPWMLFVAGGVLGGALIGAWAMIRRRPRQIDPDQDKYPRR